ncbi:putative serine dehydratase domain-containing protein [Scheffersomyces xylosifermentans]|uniref:putative serine dehydratase domain-containing protein n=1 Tax=Scheffersomyces xylosifermentans TaxID=1304137 RepID=UPI00315C79AD
MSNVSYTSTFNTHADKRSLLHAFKGKSVSQLPTPSVIINRDVFIRNCKKMLENAEKLDVDFRAHIKTHKTLEGAALQLSSSRKRTDKLIVSTLTEAWNLLPLVEEGLVNDILYSLPVVKSRLEELADLADKVPHFRLLLDHEEQLRMLADFNRSHPSTKKWSAYIKIDMGTHRAGLINNTDALAKTLKKLLTDDSISSQVELYGFYCHAGHSYSSKDENSAKSLLLEEIKHANLAAIAAKEICSTLDLHLSVGATPTSHASELLTREELEVFIGKGVKMQGQIELHAGNYPCCDLQQLATGCIKQESISISLIAEVVSTYPERGDKAPGEQLINAGVVALSRESGPIAGYGKVVKPEKYNNWVVGRLSQEHGILVPSEDNSSTEFIPIGTQVRIIPQHACITAAAHPWYYVIDSSDTVVDIWVPFRGW